MASGSREGVCVACVASVSVWFRSKERPRNGILGYVRARNETFPSFFPHPLPALLLAPFFARSLTLVPRSLPLNGKEMLATQAMLGGVLSIMPHTGGSAQKRVTLFTA